MNNLIILLLFILLTGIAVLDFKGKISVVSKWNVWYTLFVMPHIFLLAVIFEKYLSVWSLVIICLYCVYCLVRLHICPVLKDESENLRLIIMAGGRILLLFGITAFLMQSLAYILLWNVIQRRVIPNQQISSQILLIDGVITAVCVLLLLLNGLFRVYFTSRRLGIVRRAVFLLIWWVPIVNIVMVLDFCRQVRWEYDHECNKVILHKVRVDSRVCATKYPLLMVHGIGFRDLKYLNYWGRIPREIIRNGARVYYGHQEAMGNIEDNARDIQSKIFEIIEETHCEKVNIIGHSKGGLDARYMISEYNMGPYVSSLTTIATPHQGSELLDVLAKLPDKLFRKIASLIDLHFRNLGDRNPDCYTSSRQMLPSYVQEFNRHVRDVEGVYYQSYALVMKNVFSDTLLWFPYAIIKHIKGPNDGLVCVESAKWGEFRGILTNTYRRGISHADIIDLKREDIRGFDIKEQYVKIISELKEMNF